MAQTKVFKFPSGWLMGCTQGRIKRGEAKDYRDALRQCVKHWQEQENAEHAEIARRASRHNQVGGW